MTEAELITFIRRVQHAVQASIHADGAPQAATVGVAVTDELDVVFDTLGATRKAANLRRDPRCALVVTEGEVTVQMEGVADEPTGDELVRLQAVYFEAFPDGRARMAWPGITWFRVRPRWIRVNDFTRTPSETMIRG
jgi:hypothetical protein